MNHTSKQLPIEASEVTPQEMEQAFIDYLVNGNGGPPRRIAFAVLGKSSDHLYQTKYDTESIEALLSGVEALNEYINGIEFFVDTLRSGQARMFAVLQHCADNHSGVQEHEF